MEFWGKEVKPGATVSCKVDDSDDLVIHLSQAALGETKKASENVTVSVKIDNNKIVLGTLSAENHPQISCDLVFDKDFELSHNSKTASVFFCGYKSPVPMFGPDSGESSDEELETYQVPNHNKEKTKISTAKVPVKGVMKVESSSEDDDDDLTDSESDSEMSDEDDSSDEDEVSSGADPSDDSGSEEQTPTPKKTDVVVGKKRAIEAEAASGKKAKSEQCAQKTGDKVSTHSAKLSSKATADKSTKTPTADEKSPKSGGHACKSCNKSFSSASGLASHQKAKKHEA